MGYRDTQEHHRWQQGSVVSYCQSEPFPRPFSLVTLSAWSCCTCWAHSHGHLSPHSATQDRRTGLGGHPTWGPWRPVIACGIHGPYWPAMAAVAGVPCQRPSPVPRHSHYLCPGLLLASQPSIIFLPGLCVSLQPILPLVPGMSSQCPSCEKCHDA